MRRFFKRNCIYILYTLLHIYITSTLYLPPTAPHPVIMCYQDIRFIKLCLVPLNEQMDANVMSHPAVLQPSEILPSDLVFHTALRFAESIKIITKHNRTRSPHPKLHFRKTGMNAARRIPHLSPNSHPRSSRSKQEVRPRPQLAESCK